MPSDVRGIVNKKKEVGTDGEEKVHYKVKLKSGGDKWLTVDSDELDEKHIQNFERKRKERKKEKAIGRTNSVQEEQEGQVEKPATKKQKVEPACGPRAH